MGKSSTSFKPGQSGNPAGRPSLQIDPVRWEEIRADKQSMKDCIRKFLKLKVSELDQAALDCTAGEAIAIKMIIRAIGRPGMEADHNTAKVVLEYAFGQMDDGPGQIDLNPTEQEMINEYRRRTANPGLTHEDSSG
jgi:hypothetical protein